MNPPKLVIFDVDNTLTYTGEADRDCFLGVMASLFNFKNIETDFSKYKHVVAVSIIAECFKTNIGRAPKKKEIEDQRDTFVAALMKKAEAEPEGFSEVPGASAMMTELLKKEEYAVAIATGSFSGAAAFKLDFAKIPFDRAVIASSDECLTREELIDSAVTKAKTKYNMKNFSSIISVGDGLWDLKTAENIGLPFIGVGNKAILEKNGVEMWVPDFEDREGFFEVLGSI